MVALAGHRRGGQGVTRPARRAAGLCLALVVALAAGCGRVETPKVTPVVTTLRVAADAAALPLMRALTDAYTAQKPEIIFTLQQGNAETAADAVFSQQADVAAVSRLPATVPGRSGLWVGDLALDGVAVIVNPANPIETLTMQDLRDIFAGARNRWDDFGATGAGDVSVAVREEGDGTRATFDEVVMGDTRLTLSAVVLPSIDVTMNFVAYQRGAIAYVPSARITETVLPAVKVLGVEGQPLTKEAISTGSYRLTRMLNMIAGAEPQGELREFVAWVLGPNGQRVIASMNYVRVGQAQH
jgi:phosphate transport system substrate-binding protein